ncbi:hypothetical protein EKD04_021155 [Chloroflexales bacterium ZM16-3]|nr:hypothetical protein [Chloroflexales bacterium ZM16-3]
MSYTLTLEPAAAAWRGPQQLVLKVAAERVADVEYRLDLPTRPRAAGKPALLQEVARICPTCTHAHSLAFSLAVESLLGRDAPPRAARLRLVAAELERAVSHLVTLDAIFVTMGMTHLAASLAGLRDTAAQGMALLAGAPDGGALILPGGLRRDLSDDERLGLRQLLSGASRRLYQLADSVIDQRLILARTVEVGVLSGSAVTQFGLHGPLARASGITEDVRLDTPYGAYGDLSPQLITQESGDVYARLVLLLLEALESLKLSDRALEDLPDGPLSAQMPASLPEGEGVATVEAPRGALRYRVESDGRRISGYQADPSPQLDRLLARTILSRAALDDVVLIALSTDPCSACQGASGE